MTILSFDTSGLSASVAAAADGKLIGEYFVDLKLTHSQTLMPMLDTLLSALGLTVKDIDYIAVTNGPGSFTGLRIGAAAALGLAFAVNKEIVPVPTLDALAYNVVMPRGLVVPLMDAKRGQVYTAVYRYENAVMTRLTDYYADGLDAIIETALGYEDIDNIIFTGDAVGLVSAANPRLRCAPMHLNRQRAASAAALAFRYINEGRAVKPDGFKLEYVRKPQAERIYDKN
jgi:tRNA threonylcarbamoyladenosine biosynthesis protein TsaB